MDDTLKQQLDWLHCHFSLAEYCTASAFGTDIPKYRLWLLNDATYFNAVMIQLVAARQC